MRESIKCYIRKIDQDIMDKLNNLGYKDGWTNTISTEELKTSTFVSTKCWSLTGFADFWEDYFDCGTNEELFFALASLRDDTDKGQWFTDGKIWEKCEDDLPSKYMQLEGHKATYNEIINYFKSK